MPSRSLRQRAERLLVTLGVATVLAVVAAFAGPVPSAGAHTSLVGMSPSDGSTVTSAPTSVVLTFDEAVATVGAAVVVTAPSGARVGDGPAVVNGAVVTQPLLALTEPGRYVVAYRVVADDGHPVTATRSFSLGTASGSTPTAIPTSPTSPPSSTSSGSPGAGSTPAEDGVPVPAIAAGALTLLVAAGLVVAVAVRRRAAPGPR